MRSASSKHTKLAAVRLEDEIVNFVNLNCKFYTIYHLFDPICAEYLIFLA